MKKINLSNEICRIPWALNIFNDWRQDLCNNLHSRRTHNLLKAKQKFTSLHIDKMQFGEDEIMLVCKEFLYYCSMGSRVSINDRSVLDDYRIEQASDQIMSKLRIQKSLETIIQIHANEHAEKAIQDKGLQASPSDEREAATGDTYLLQLDELVKICNEVNGLLQEAEMPNPNLPS